MTTNFEAEKNKPAFTEEEKKTVGERIKEIRKNSPTKTQQAFADACGFNRAYLASLESGKQFPSSNIMLQLKNTFNVSLDWLLTGVGAKYIAENREENGPGLQKLPCGLFFAGDQIFIPLSGIDACCGDGIMTYPQDYTLDNTVRVKKSSVGVLEEERLPFAVETHGRSMEGFGIPESSIVVVNPAEDIQSGDIVLIIVDEKAAIKKFYRRPDGEDFIASTGDRIHATAEEMEDGYYLKKIGKVMLVIAPPEHGV